ncbi:MAG TPA: cytochrome c biogenesis protein CcdA [Holophagaceae bacterium]|nr:cytochrome c biogenesis protein CcdA [Holophagaceae bacterium]
MARMRWIFMVALAAFGAQAASAQGAKPLDPKKDIGLAFQQGAVVLTVPDGAHLKAAFMKVEKKDGPGTLSAGPLPPTDGVDELGDPVWHRKVRIPLKGEGLAGAVTLKVTYQPCTEGEGGVCYAPTTRELEVAAAQIMGAAAKSVKAPAAAASPIHEESRPAQALPTPAPATAEPAPAGEVREVRRLLGFHAPENLKPWLERGANPDKDPGSGLWALLVIFAFGMVASLTPCVYPMIPITMAIIGAKGGGKARGFALSVMLVVGMACTYTLLGVVAARTGATFGAFAQKPAFLVPVSILFSAFALSLFGAFEIRLPAGLQSKLQGEGPRKGYGGAFVMGLVLGPISAPCVGPIIGTVLLSIAQAGEVVGGAIKLFAFALGMGVLFVAVGTFSAALPRSGDWLDRLKRFMGLVILGFAAWNLRYLVPVWANYGMWTLIGLLGAVLLGAFRPAEGTLAGLAKGAGLASLALALLLGIRGVEAFEGIHLLPGGAGEAQADPLWIDQDFERAVQKARAEGKVVLVDTYAEWCAQCHELDEKTWPDPSVQAWIRANAIAVRIDTYKVRPDLAEKLHIASYPTILILDPKGSR